MIDIYQILPKYFMGEVTNEEQELVQKFKEENNFEYKMLKRLWEKGDVNVVEFDAPKALQKVKCKVKPVRKINRLKWFSQVAAILILAITTSVFIYQTQFKEETAKLITQENNTTSNMQVILPDSTIVWLSKHASLSYPQKFKNKKRNVTMSGQAFFLVKRNEKKPFIVKTDNAFVEVLGTSFNINSTTNRSKVDVRTGKVKVSNMELNKSTILTKGMTASVENGAVTSGLSEDPNYLSWKTGIFRFRKASLKKIVHQLNTYLKKPIKIDPKVTDDYELTLQFKQPNITYISELIELTCDVQIKEFDKHYLIIRNKDDKTQQPSSAK
ncbi:FecR family protein [Puteibacter caeruleilacunae]|nr:FecR family protein [Puteibacter caeruleilacunae]